MSKKPDPQDHADDGRPGSVEEPDCGEWAASDEAFEDALIARNREELARSLERALRDLDEGRCIPWKDAVAEIDAMLSSLETGK